MTTDAANLVNQSETVDYHSPLLHCSGNGKPIATIENLEEILRRLGWTIRYNAISRKREINVTNMEVISDEYDEAARGELESECSRFNYTTGKLDVFIANIAARNAYNPVADWILSKPWDGIDRIGEFFATIRSTNERLKEILMHRWMIQCIGAVFEPMGISAQGILVFQGDQYLGKTSWLKALVPGEIGPYVKDGAILKLDDKDSILNCIRFWLVELGELEATFRKSDIAQLKAFVTARKDIIRTPYSRTSSEFPRRTSFFGSVNQQEFLHDPTGNRRFWVVECEEVNWNHGLDMQQVWRQFYEEYRAGERWYLTSDELKMLNENNVNFETKDYLFERLESEYNWHDLDAVMRSLTSTEIAIELGMKSPTQAELRRISSAVRKLSGRKSEMKRGGAGKQPGKRFLIPLPKVTCQYPVTC